MKDGICFPPLRWYAQAHDAVCGQPSQSITQPENEQEKNSLLSVWAKQYQMFESICCLFGGIITTFCFYVALSQIKFTAWRRERERECAKEFRISPWITDFDNSDWREESLQSHEQVVPFRWKQWEFIWLEMLEKD